MSALQGTPKDLLELTELSTAVTAAPGAASSKMFPVHLSLGEQYMHRTALPCWLKENKAMKKKRREKKLTREINPSSCLLQAALCSRHLQSLTFRRTLTRQTAVLPNEGGKKAMVCKKEIIPGPLWLRRVFPVAPLGSGSLGDSTACI